ncbi:MAG TPA: glycosyltransferase family 2 protein [Candidatus Sulfotelmatobacter sp.]|nr:glycosyltransferase family 2 protein [Candidatus Sulfotelmatobacter sp.]
MPIPDTLPDQPQLSVIVPARNEEASLAACLESLVSQPGIDFEIIVVNDHSTDRTREIAESFAKVRVVEAGPLPAGWTGKNNAVATGAQEAKAEWLLFTDADTIHLPGSLARSLREAKEHNSDLLSYSPEQIAVTFWEMAVLPVIFAELARQYPPSKVSDPNSPEAAANGQFLLIRREVYDAIGGHAVVATDILEDVALARRVKASGYKLRFRYAADAVRTRMYRNFAQLREGWTKNLALLFPKPGWLAMKDMALWTVCWSAFFLPARHWWLDPFIVFWLIVYLYLWERLKKANFPASNTLWATFFGMPMFAYLLFRSKRAHGGGSVRWKGRTYIPSHQATAKPNSSPPGNPFMKTPLALLLLPIAASTICMAVLHAQPADNEPQFTNTVIEPGSGIGPLKLNDSRDKALQLFPKKEIDQEWDDPCGTTIDWTDSTNPVGHGDVFIRVKKGKIFQIESSTTRFQTAEGITTFDSPEKVANAYRNMKAGVLLTDLSPALGSRPLVFWFDKKKGLAFAFAYDRPHHKRYVYKIIVFEPNKNFCPEQDTMNSNKWQSIQPYSEEPPRDLSPELSIQPQ